MEVTSKIERWDIALFQLELLLKSSVLHIITVAFFVLAIISYARFQDLSDTLSIAVIPLFVWGTFLFVCAVNALVLPSKFLGTSHYSIIEDGFREHSKSGDTFTLWKDVRDIHKSRSYMSVRISFFMYHIVPKRSFDTASAFDEFYEAADAMRGSALSNT